MSDSGQKNIPLAIIGMCCRLPGARNLDEFWQLIESGGDAVGKLPDDVLDRDLYFDPQPGMRNKSYSDVGGLTDRRPFDNSKCRLPEEIISNYDPAALTMCEVASDALRDAAYDPFNVPYPKAGVYFGHTGGSPKAGDILYSVYIEQTARYLHRLKSLEGLTGVEIESIARDIIDEVRERCDHRVENPGFDPSPHLGAELIARAYGLDGPCIVVDAACASSLQALSIGARALQLGEIDMAVCGGASYCKSDSLVLFSQAYSISAGKSCPFDKNATGLITAEGYVTLILKTLDKALADGDRIRCIIRGIGMAADGRGKSLWAPRKEGQIIAMQRAYPHPLKPEDMQYIEAHATSTQVGDATELAALAGAFPSRTASGRKIALGSVKGNIGHTLETAGVAGLVKAALAMEHGVIPPVANLTEPNPTVTWEDLPFHLPTKAESWEKPADGGPRRAAVNSFGIGGLNVHIVLEEFLPELAAARGAGRSRASVATVAKEPIAVIGAGAILPGARTLEAFWELLESARDPKCDAPPDRWDSALFYDPEGREAYRCRNKHGGFITDYHYDWRRHRVPPKQIANANPLQFMLLDATEEALQRAGYLDKDFDRDRVGVIVGSIFGGDFSNELQAGLRLPEFARALRGFLQEKEFVPSQIDEAIKEYEEVLLAEMPALLDETGSFTSSTLASRITKTFDLKGGALAMDAGNSSGLAAIGACVNALRRGVCDMMICATGQRNMDVTAFESMTRFDFLARGESHPAYDKSAEGYLPGEGCGALLLKRLSDARRDGDPILAVLHGVAASADWNRPGAAMQKALQRAMAGAGASAREIRSVEALGMLPGLAKTEVEAVAEVLAKGDGERPVTINSLVSQFGFMGAAHSMAATIKAVLSVSRGHIPAGIVTHSPREDLSFSPSIQPQQEAIALSPDNGDAVGVSCGGELGTAYYAIVQPAASALAKRKAKSGVVPTVAAPFVVRVGASDWDSLRGRLLTGTADDLYQPDRAFTSGDLARVAIVCTNAEDFANKCGTAAKQLENRGQKSRGLLADNGIYFGEPQPFSGGCAFVFPGQGSQYPGMLSQLIEQLPEAREARRQVDAAMKALGYDSYDGIAGREAKDLGTDVWKTQVSMLLANWIVDETLRRLGVRPSLVAGHSFGEYAALACAGGWSLSDAIRCTRHRYQSIVESPGGDGCMAATNLSQEVAERYLAAAGDGVYPANLNAPNQTVIAGTQAAVERCVELMKKDRHSAVIINVPCPFHTPLMADTVRRFVDHLPEIPIRDGNVPVVSTATGQVMTRAEEFAESLATQLSTPVDYRQMVRAIVKHRPALVVEVGPQEVLTRLNKKNHKADDVVFLASDVRRRPGAASLLGVLAQADCLGCLELDEWHRAKERTAATQASGRILVFDATERRTAKKREQAKGLVPGKKKVTGVAKSPAPRKESPAEAASVPSVPTASSADIKPATPIPASTPEPTGEPTPSEAVAGPTAKELQEILVGFVVDQTGYPEDIIEMDADLEADLGIDSIKKAQLFGEVGQQFQIAPREDMSLDDFPTLNHVIEFLVKELGSRSEDTAVSPPSADSPASPAPPQIQPSVSKQTPATAVASTPAIEDAPAPSPGSPGVDVDELKGILVGFVVDQTGYPEDIIEMDADLEADLGIDSIKKAQLFGEVGQQFQIAPREDMSLDDFPTLNHVIEFLVEELGSRTDHVTKSVEPPLAQPGPPLEQDPAPVVEASVAAPDSDAPAPTVEEAELREILVGFVVDQTGYPEDIIEMDADLEADLGIDSIKKAQLFGEVGERFQIAPREDMSLDDFPTLSHVIAFLVEELGSRTGAAPAVAPADNEQETLTAPPSMAVAAPSVALDTDEIREVLIGLVVEQTGYPGSMVDMDASLESDLGFEGSKKARFLAQVAKRFSLPSDRELPSGDFATLADVLGFVVGELESQTRAETVSASSAADEATGATPPQPAAPASAESIPAATDVSGSPDLPAAVDAEELREILVSFVVDQTGYPEDIIEMDADLEADLGIDSIKKAQLFGEVGERFQIAPREDMSLDDFPTLNHVIAFLVDELGSRTDSATPAPEPMADQGNRAETKGAEGKDTASTSPKRPKPLEDFVQVQVLEGSPRDFGWQHGSDLRRSIHRELATLADGPQATNGNGAIKWPDHWTEELAGLARGAEVNQSAILVWNLRAEPLAALRTEFGTQVNGVLMPLQRDFVTLVQVRRPSDGLAYITIGKPARLWAPAAINAARLAFSCEPLDQDVPPTDVLAIAKRLHHVMATSECVAETQTQLQDLPVKGRWCFGVSTPGQSDTVYCVCESGQIRPGEKVASPQQKAFHQSLDADPSTLVLTDRRSGTGKSILLEELLPAAPVRKTQTATPVQEEQPASIMQRNVLRMTPAARPASAGKVYSQGELACIIGDSTIDSTLREHLTDVGCRIANVAGPDWLASFEQSVEGEIPKHLVLLSESIETSPSLDTLNAADRFAEVFGICRAWVAALEAADAITGATLVAVTRMGGDFGFHSSGANYAGGAMTGLLKGIRREYPALRIKVLDFDQAAEPATVVRELVEELDSGTGELEVGFRSGERYVVEALAQTAPTDGSHPLKQGGVWIVTGGGRGVTSVVARQLGRQFNLKLHLLGTAPLPDAEASWRGMNDDQLRQLKRDTALQARKDGKSPADEWRRIEKSIELDGNLRQFADEGVQATYHRCDIRDRESLAATLQQVRDGDGPIDGIVHGAGIEAACKFVRKKPDMVKATIASKCDGVANLVALTRDDPLRYFVGFGSTSGRFGGLGQADYSLASDLLAKMMAPVASEHSDCAAVCFHWPAWDEVGMAVRPESKMALEHGGISFMPTCEGVAHLINELQSGSGEREILILDKPEPLDTDATMSRTTAPVDPSVFRAGTSDSPDSGGAPSQATGANAPQASGTVSDSVVDCSRMPLVDAIRPGVADGPHVAEILMDASKDPFLVHHRFRGKPFVPVVVSLEMLAEAAAAWKAPSVVTGVRDLQILNGWYLEDNCSQETRVRMEETEEGIRCELVGPFFNSKGQMVEEERVYVSGVVELGHAPPQIEPIEPGKPVYDWFPFLYPEGMEIYHGPPFRTLRKVDFQHGGGRVIIVARARDELIGDRAGDGMLCASAALDGCMVGCGAFGYAMLERSLGIPLGMRCYRQSRLPHDGEQCTLRFFLREMGEMGVLYDFILLGEPGDVIFDVQGYRTARVQETV